jgi:hypothetical protein
MSRIKHREESRKEMERQRASEAGESRASEAGERRATGATREGLPHARQSEPQSERHGAH